jgi:hypothetical protein
MCCVISSERNLLLLPISYVVIMIFGAQLILYHCPNGTRGSNIHYLLLRICSYFIFGFQKCIRSQFIFGFYIDLVHNSYLDFIGETGHIVYLGFKSRLVHNYCMGFIQFVIHITLQGFKYLMVIKIFMSFT